MKKKITFLFILVLFTLMYSSGYAQNKVVKGTITDSSGLPIPGVNVVIKGTTTGISTDMDGKYAISVTPGQVLVFSSTGSKTVEKTVGQSDVENIVLLDDIAQLSEVVVVGYGTVKKSDVTGAIVSVSAEKLTSRPVTNALQGLQGKAAGVDITSSERPGTLGSVRIRGNRSLTATNDPLYVVDGVPLMSASSIETLNPRDIASIDILKDASATAIYGSRGANGVIIVTTKQGKSGKFTLNYAGTVTTTEIVDRSPSMSAADFINFRRWAQYNLPPAPGTPPPPHPDTPTYANDLTLFASSLDGQTSRDNVMKGWMSGTWDPSKVTNTDWTKYVTQAGITTEHVLSASGGSEKINGYGSFGYLDDEGTQKGQWYKRYTAKASTNINPVDWFKMTASLNATWSEQDFGMSTLGGGSNSNPNAIYGQAKAIYNMAVPYDANGKIIINPGGENGVFSIINEWEKSTQQSQIMRLLGNFSATFDIGKIWEPVKGLSYKLNFGPDFRHWREGVYIDGTSVRRTNADGSPGTNFARLQNRRDFSWTLDNMLTYDRTFKEKHNVGATLLQTASSWNIENSSMDATNIDKPSFLWNAFGTVDITNPANQAHMSSGLTERQLSSYMARLNYGYDGRYLLTVSGRWDGASQLGEGHKWDFFPSAALGWRISKEDFMKDVAWVDNLKLRLGFGTTGNSSVDPYSTKGDISKIFLPFNGMSNQTGYTTNEPYYTGTQNSMANAELGWEKTTQYNLGVDFAFLNNRINGSVELYKSYTSDLIMQMIIPTLTGFPTTFANIGKTNNTGVEVTLNLIPVQTTSGFIWETTLIGAWQKDKIEELAYGKNGDMPDNAWFIGESINVRYGFDNAGIWQNTPEDLAEMAIWNAVPNGDRFTVGNVRPVDQDGDHKMTVADRVVLGNSNPNWTMGWNNTFEYKGFELGIEIYGRMGYMASLGGEALTSHANQRETDYWTPINTGAEFQKPILAQATSGSADKYSGLLGFQEAGFVKIRNISLGYNFPEELATKMGVANMKLYAQAISPGSLYQSLDWYDFDVNTTYYNRSFVMGIEVGF